MISTHTLSVFLFYKPSVQLGCNGYTILSAKVCYTKSTMEKIPLPKSRGSVKETIQRIIDSLPEDKGNIATMDTQDVVQEPKQEARKKPIIKKQEKLTWTQDVSQEKASIPEVSPELDEDLPTAEEFTYEGHHDGNTIRYVPHKEEFKQVQSEIAEDLLYRAIVNDDIALAFTQYNILRTKTKKDTDDYRWQLQNLIKKISGEEKKKYDDAVRSIPPEDPKRLVATRRRALIEESLGKYKAALENNTETIELPEDVQDLPEDDLPKTVDTSLKMKIHQQTTDAQRDMLPYLFNNALQRKDYMTALNQLWYSKKIAPEMYVEYNTRMLEALDKEISELESTIAAEKEKTKKSFLQKAWDFFKKPLAEPENEIIKTSEQKIAHFKELKESMY